MGKESVTMVPRVRVMVVVVTTKVDCPPTTVDEPTSRDVL
jgi:hypothetical protein